MITYSTFTIEDFRGTTEFLVVVEGNITHGGSNSYGSDDPPWIECEITEIYNPKPSGKKKVSDRLFNALVEEYGDSFEEVLCDECGE